MDLLRTKELLLYYTSKTSLHWNLAAIEERTKDSYCQNRELHCSYEQYQFRLIEVNKTGYIVAHWVWVSDPQEYDQSFLV